MLCFVVIAMTMQAAMVASDSSLSPNYSRQSVAAASTLPTEGEGDGIAADAAAAADGDGDSRDEMLTVAARAAEKGVERMERVIPYMVLKPLFGGMRKGRKVVLGVKEGSKTKEIPT